MLALLLLATASGGPAEEARRPTAVEPVRAMVRILRGAEIRFSEKAHFDVSIRREAKVREPDGSLRPASLIEFY
jgi:hypothetical protein